MQRIPESRVVEIWQERLRHSRRLITSDGEPVEIVYPGRRNDDRGADYKDATVISGAEIANGCIEIHSKSSDWRAHGHHIDPVYNQVVLHVAMSESARSSGTISQGGKSIPTVILGERTSIVQPDGLQTRSTLPCHEIAKRLPETAIAELLEAAGDARFQEQAAAYHKGLEDEGQLLYRGLMCALGYARNKLPFIELAQRVPMSRIKQEFEKTEPEPVFIARLQALLTGSAGLLPSQRAAKQVYRDDRVEKLEEFWSESQETRAMPCTAWHGFKVRPGNSPVRRIAAMSHLVWRYRERGLLGSLLNLVRESPEEDGSGLEKALMVSASGYWADHFDFGAVSGSLTPVLIGRGRAAEMVVNVLLPFTLAWSQADGSSELARKVTRLHHGYPRLESNSIEKHMMTQFGLSGRMVNSAHRQQGLLHIYHSMCARGRCMGCDFGQME